MANPFQEFQDRYARNWVGLVQDVVGWQPDEMQAAVLTAICTGERRIAIRSGHGVGKTSVLAHAILCHALTRFPQVTVVTAPTSAQLFDALAAQTKAAFKKLPPALLELFDVKTESITHRAKPDESFVSFRTSRPEMPEALAGVHAEHVLLLGDEASGIPESVFVAASGSMSGQNACTVLAGNPVRTSGLFYEVFHSMADRWRCFHISCVGHPRVTPDFLLDMEDRYGLDTNDYRVRVLGEFPRAEADSVIPYETLQLALIRDVQPTLVRPIWGVDCARFGSDRSSLVIRRGNVQTDEPETWKGLETMELAGRIKARWDLTMQLDRPDAICVDAIGLGAGVADRLAEMGLPARSITVSEAPALSSDQYLNLKAELWWQAREWFAARNVALRSSALAAELGWPRYGYTSSGKLKIETKDETRKRHKRSPDIADGFIMTFAAPAVSALYGSAGSTRWAEPLQREIKCLV